MSPRHRYPSTVSRLQGALAWMLAGLVFALGLLTVSPTLHAHLHGETSDHHRHATAHPHDDSGCAVTLFQQGVTPPLDLPRLDIPRETWIATLPPAPDTPIPAAPSYLLQPARGPPCIG
jgi:hypothetical protein